MISSNLMIYPIGGVEEIGSNCTIYYYNGHVVVLDYGISMYSLDDLTPYSASYINLNDFVERFEKEIKSFSIIITHCHDDHIAGLYLLTEDNIEDKLRGLNIQIYVCSQFNKEIILSKSGNVFPNINVIGMEKTHSIDEDLTFTYHEVDHSIPSAAGVYLVFNKLRIFHTGDWRFDENVLAIKTAKESIDKVDSIDSKSLKTFVRLRNKCDILISESTNVTRVTPYCNEKRVTQELEQVFANAASKNKEILFSCFASNVQRLTIVIRTAIKLNLKLSYMGRAMSLFISCAHKAGIITNKEFAYIKGHTNLENLMKCEANIKLVTGCQNETNSILNKLAYANKKCLSGKQMIVFSANVIPVSRKRVENLYKQLERMNVHVLTTDINPFIHSSGHATRNEIMRMYEIINPKIVLPVHGNVVAIREHSKMINAKFKLPNLKPKYLRYFVFETNQNKAIKYNVLNMQDKYVTEKRSLDYRIYDSTHEVFNERRKLIRNGIIIINVSKRLIMPVGTRLNNLTIQKIIDLCETYSKNPTDIINFRKIKMQVQKMVPGFSGEINVS